MSVKGCGAAEAPEEQAGKWTPSRARYSRKLTFWHSSSLMWSATLEVRRDSNHAKSRGKDTVAKDWKMKYLVLVSQQKEACEMTPWSTTYTSSHSSLTRASVWGQLLYLHQVQRLFKGSYWMKCGINLSIWCDAKIIYLYNCNLAVAWFFGFPPFINTIAERKHKWLRGNLWNVKFNPFGAQFV